MDLWQLILVVGSLLAATSAFVWLALRLGSGGAAVPKKNSTEDLEHAAVEDVEHIFNDEFREELRNRGRLHFEKIIGENAMFLQQDLRLTTSQLNDYMKEEIKRVLQDEFSKYEETINGAKEMAIESIQRTQSAIEQQREILEKQLLEEVAAEKARIVNKFEKNMADIVNHYILTAIGNEIDLTEQLDYIFQYLDDNKTAILEDVKHGT